MNVVLKRSINIIVICDNKVFLKIKHMKYSKQLLFDAHTSRYKGLLQGRGLVMISRQVCAANICLLACIKVHLYLYEPALAPYPNTNQRTKTGPSPTFAFTQADKN